AGELTTPESLLLSLIGLPIGLPRYSFWNETHREYPSRRKDESIAAAKMLGLRRCVGTRLGNFEAASEEPSGTVVLQEVTTIIFGQKRLSTKKRPVGFFVQMPIISSLPPTFHVSSSEKIRQGRN